MEFTNYKCFVYGPKLWNSLCSLSTEFCHFINVIWPKTWNSSVLISLPTIAYTFPFYCSVRFRRGYWKTWLIWMPSFLSRYRFLLQYNTQDWTWHAYSTRLVESINPDNQHQVYRRPYRERKTSIGLEPGSKRQRSVYRHAIVCVDVEWNSTTINNYNDLELMV